LRKITCDFLWAKLEFKSLYTTSTLVRHVGEKMERPTAAFVLILIGGILILINAALFIYAGAIAEEAAKELDITGMYPGLAEIIGAALLTIGIVGLVFAILVIIGSVLVYSGVPGRVKAGSILAIVFGILSIIIGGGIFIGLILALIGGILGLRWKPRTPPAPTPAPTTTTPQV
jgi:MFS family permease